MQEEQFGNLDHDIQQRIVSALRSLRGSAQELYTLWEEHDELNDMVSIGSVIPMSLDEWVIELDMKIADYLNLMEGKNENHN